MDQTQYSPVKQEFHDNLLDNLILVGRRLDMFELSG